jgi:hypothetical protein
MLSKADWLILAAFLSFLFSVSLWFGIGMSASKESWCLGRNLGFLRFSRPETIFGRQREPGEVSDAAICIVGAFACLLLAASILFTFSRSLQN